MIVVTAESSSTSIFSQEEKNSWDMLLSGQNVISPIIPFDGTIFVSAIRAMV
jgi:hypothetical protein